MADAIRRLEGERRWSEFLFSSFFHAGLSQVAACLYWRQRFLPESPFFAATLWVQVCTPSLLCQEWSWLSDIASPGISPWLLFIFLMSTHFIKIFLITQFWCSTFFIANFLTIHLIFPTYIHFQLTLVSPNTKSLQVSHPILTILFWLLY